MHARGSRGARHDAEPPASGRQQLLGSAPAAGRVVGDDGVDGKPGSSLLTRITGTPLPRHSLTMRDGGVPFITTIAKTRYSSTRSISALMSRSAFAALSSMHWKPSASSAAESVARNSAWNGCCKSVPTRPTMLERAVDQALREPVDAIAEVSGGVENALADLARHARARRERARHRGTRHAGAPRDVGGGDERRTQCLLVHGSPPPLHTCACCAHAKPRSSLAQVDCESRSDRATAPSRRARSGASHATAEMPANGAQGNRARGPSRRTEKKPGAKPGSEDEKKPGAKPGSLATDYPRINRW